MRRYFVADFINKLRLPAPPSRRTAAAAPTGRSSAPPATTPDFLLDQVIVRIAFSPAGNNPLARPGRWQERACEPPAYLPALVGTDRAPVGRGQLRLRRLCPVVTAG